MWHLQNRAPAFKENKLSFGLLGPDWGKQKPSQNKANKNKTSKQKAPINSNKKKEKKNPKTKQWLNNQEAIKTI